MGTELKKEWKEVIQYCVTDPASQRWQKTM
jgi:hypothetical protein